MHGFLLLKSGDGKVIAVGDQINVARGAHVHSRLVLHFRDGSIDDEVTTFEQRSVFHLISDHHVQRGPSFPDPLDITFDAATGMVTTREMKDGKEQSKTEHMDLPPNLVNGLISSILESFPPEAPEMRVSYLTASPKPRVVTLVIKPDGKDFFLVQGTRRPAKRYTVHIELGGITGVIAPVVGKQPDDEEIWVEDGEVPAFIKLQGALFQQGPIWTLELLSPSWPESARH